MAIQVDWDPQTQICTLTTGESLTLDDVIEAVGRSDLATPKRFLWDLRALRQGPDSTPELRRAAALGDGSVSRAAGARSAILVARDVDYGIARMFFAFAEGSGVSYQVFRDRAEALSWLCAPVLD